MYNEYRAAFICKDRPCIAAPSGHDRHHTSPVIDDLDLCRLRALQLLGEVYHGAVTNYHLHDVIIEHRIVGDWSTIVDTRIPPT